MGFVHPVSVFFFKAPHVDISNASSGRGVDTNARGEVNDRLADPAVREPLVQYLKGLGFCFVTLDLEGFRSGSLNKLVSLEFKKQFAQVETIS